MSDFPSDGGVRDPYSVNQAGQERPVQRAVLALGEYTSGGVFVDYMTEEEEINWALLCRSKDMVQDTDLAVNAYCKLPPTRDWDTLYLTLFGVLQALVVQQDAVQTLCDAIGHKINVKQDPDLFRIREIRNDSVGHPTNRRPDKKRRPRMFGIVRSSLANGRFTLSSLRGNDHAHEDVSVRSLIDTQEPVILELLKAATEHIAARAKKIEESGWEARFPG